MSFRKLLLLGARKQCIPILCKFQSSTANVIICLFAKLCRLLFSLSQSASQTMSGKVISKEPSKVSSQFSKLSSKLTSSVSSNKDDAKEPDGDDEDLEILDKQFDPVQIIDPLLLPFHDCPADHHLREFFINVPVGELLSTEGYCFVVLKLATSLTSHEIKSIYMVIPDRLVQRIYTFDMTQKIVFGRILDASLMVLEE